MTNLLAVSMILSLGAHHQATLYFDHNQYAEAATLCRQTLQNVQPGTLEAALMLRDLARAYRGEGQFNRAVAAQRQQIEILRTRLGEEDGNVAIELDRLGEMYFEQKRFTEAGKMFGQALRIAETALDPHNPHFATILNDLGAAYHRNGRDGDAVKLFRRSLEIRDSAVTRENLAALERVRASRE
jgi:tetratricopeptide (TPR) repeat protein